MEPIPPGALSQTKLWALILTQKPIGPKDNTQIFQVRPSR